jgi:hypothetical protein
MEGYTVNGGLGPAQMLKSTEGKSDELNKNRIENKRRIKKDAHRLQRD